MRTTLLACLALTLLLASRPSRASACTVGAPQPAFDVSSEDPPDGAGPPTPRLRAAIVQDSGLPQVCTAEHLLTIGLRSPSRTDDLGFELEIETAFGEIVMRPMTAPDGEVAFYLGEELDLVGRSVRARSVDASGRRSEFSRPVRIGDGTGFGCAHAGAGDAGVAAAVLLMLLGCVWTANGRVRPTRKDPQCAP